MIDIFTEYKEKKCKLYEESEVIKIFDKISINIKGGVEFVIDSKDFFVILSYLQKIFFENNKDFSFDENTLYILNSSNFLNKLNYYFSIDKIKLDNNSNEIYEKINFFIFLFSFGFNKNIKIIDLESLDKTYSLYIKKLEENIGNISSFEIFLDGFINFSELINRLCILNIGDYFKAEYNNKFKELFHSKIREVITLYGSKISKEKLLILQSFLGRIFINYTFSDILYFSKIINKNKLDKKYVLLEEISSALFSILDNIEIGYKQLVRIGKEKDDVFNDNIKRVYLGNSFYTIISFIKSLEYEYNEDNILIEKILLSDSFKYTISNILEKIGGDTKNLSFDTIQDLKFNIELIFSLLYFNNERKNVDFGDVLLDFENKKGNIDYFYLQLYRSLLELKSSSSLLDEKLIEIGNFLLKEVNYKNYNFEFSKLKIIINIIENLKKDNIDNNKKDFLLSVCNYLDKNKTSSNLLYTYAEIYLKISRYLSCFIDNESNKLSLKYHSLFLKLVPNNFDFYSFGEKLSDYEYRLGLYFLDEFFNFSKNINSQGKNIFLIERYVLDKIGKNQIISFGKKYLNDFIENNDLINKNNLDKILSDFLENVLTQDGFDEEKINKEIGIVLSSKIFNNIAEVYLFYLDDLIFDLDEFKIDIFKGVFKIDLFGNYKMFFVYPKIYEEVFLDIYKREQFYIERNIKNIINIYLKRKSVYIDYNTGLPNETKLRLELLSLKENVSFLMFKINMIKDINDLYGCDIGDEFMKKIALELEKISSLKGKIYKLFSGQFGIIVNNCENIDYIIDKIHNIKIEIFGNKFNLHSIIGIVENDNNRLIEKGQRSISYRIKMGFTDYKYNPNIISNDKSKEHLEFLQKLDEVIEEKRLKPFFQPIFDIKTLKPYKYEVLMRVLNKDGVYESPFKYLEVASYFGKLNSISYIIIEETFKYVNINGGSYSINLSAEDLLNKKLVDFIYEKIKEYNINPASITIEILEGIWNDSSNVMQIIQKFRQNGFKIAMDDFGRDGSNFNRLLEFIESKQIDYLKIDQKIIQALGYSKNYIQAEIASKILRGIIDGAHISGIKVIAEYVDSKEILDICRYLGVDLLQGFYLGKPEKDILN